MRGKENARQAWEASRAHVRKHDGIIARLRGEELPLSRKEERLLGVVFTVCGFATVMAGVLA